MKIPMKWLKEYVDVDMPVSDYVKGMIMAGNGVEGTETTGAQFDHVVVGHVLTCEDHPDSDHLHVCTVDVGEEAPLQIVCGAPNVRADAWVCCALVGAHLPGGTIKKGKIRGVESFGMLCSGPELDVPDGLYPHCGDAGIILLQDHEAEPGTDVKEVFGLGDDVVDFEILSNRPDCLSVWGMARESAAVFDKHFILPEISVTSCAGDVNDYAKVIVEDSDLCPRYCARVVKNVKIRRSPKWLREYLFGAGVRPINNIVDITNFIMLETGHPMHAFDLSKVKDQTIVVRRAHEGEKLTTLDGKVHDLTHDMLVIADAENATGLAGIMGGEESEIVEGTTTVLFECAAFDRGNNRVTARSLGMRTEASSRFEKGVMPQTARRAIERACMLVNDLDCGDVVDGIIDIYPNPSPKKEVKGSIKRIQTLISAAIPGEEMVDYLARLGLDARVEGEYILCQAPDFRSDIETEADLAEEILRLYGYDKIPSTLMKGETMAGFRSENRRLSDRIRRHMIGEGFYEAMTFSFISPRWVDRLGLEETDPRRDFVTIRNPLGEDTSVMRTTLVPSMLNSLSLNLSRGIEAVRLFEIAPIFVKNQTAGELPHEPQQLCVGLYGPEEDFYSLKNSVTSLLFSFGIRASVQAGADGYYHPGRCATLLCGDTAVCRLGEIHPDTCGNFSIDKRVYVAELSLDAIAQCRCDTVSLKPLPKFPGVSRDLAVVVRESVGAGSMLDELTRAGGKLLESAGIFDVYRNPVQLGVGVKSVAFSLSCRASDRTLTDGEISHQMEKILKALETRFDAKLRA